MHSVSTDFMFDFLCLLDRQILSISSDFEISFWSPLQQLHNAFLDDKAEGIAVTTEFLDHLSVPQEP